MNVLTVFGLALKASLILGTALIAVSISARARAAVRHVVLAAAFAALLIMPAATQLLPQRAVDLPQLRSEPAAAVAAGPFEPTTRVTTTSRPAAASVRAMAMSSGLVVGILWMAGTALALIPLVGGFRELRRIRRDAVPWPEGAAVLAELHGNHRLVRRLSVVLHRELGGPLTFGVLRPAIVFPLDAMQWGISDIRRAMCHELEHVRRADCLIDACARVACAIYWYHPLAWASWRRLRLEAERACDDAVLRSGDAVAYAEQLVSLAARLSTTYASVLAMTGGGDLSRRVRAVLDRAQRRGPAGGTWTTGVIAVGLAFVAAIAPLSGVGQVAPLPPLAYDVASVKENTSGDPSAGGDQRILRIDPGGRFTARNASVRDLLLLAYRFEITRNQLGPLDPWMDSRRFDITARAADGTVKAIDRQSAETMDRMLQGLLVERFKLRVRRESKTGDLYILSVTASGAKLKSAQNAAACVGGADPIRVKPLDGGLFPCHVFTRFGRRGFVAVAVDTGDLARTLRDALGAPVEDHAKLPTLFDAIVNWNLDRLNSGSRDQSFGAEPLPSEDDPDIFTALREQLGLKLDRQRGPVETIIVEFAQPPSPD